MNPSTSDYIAMLTRLDKNKVREPKEPQWVCPNGKKPKEGAPDGHGPYVTPGNCPECGIPLVPLNQRESALHDQIIAYCNSQWPKWKYIRARMDKKSTIQKGAQDFTLFLPGGRLLCVECKRAGEKPSPEQLAWHKELWMLGHYVATVYTFQQFLDAADGVLPPQGVSTDHPGHENASSGQAEGKE